MEESKLDMILEAILFVSRTPVPTAGLAKTAGAGAKTVGESLERLREHYATRGFILEEVAGGWQFRTHPSCAGVLKEYLQTRPVRLTKQSIETLSMIAYMQPVTKARIEEIRGVDSTGVLKFLMDHGFVRIIGKKEEPGRPFLYGTTKYFLEFFGLKNLTDMPHLEEQIELSQEELGGIDQPQEGEEAGEEGEPGEPEEDFLKEISGLLGDMKKGDTKQGADEETGAAGEAPGGVDHEPE